MCCKKLNLLNAESYQIMCIGGVREKRKIQIRGNAVTYKKEQKESERESYIRIIYGSINKITSLLGHVICGM